MNVVVIVVTNAAFNIRLLTIEVGRQTMSTNVASSEFAKYAPEIKCSANTLQEVFEKKGFPQSVLTVV